MNAVDDGLCAPAVMVVRQMKQPSKDVLREQLTLAADEIIRLRCELTFVEGTDFFLLWQLWRRLAPWQRAIIRWFS